MSKFEAKKSGKIGLNDTVRTTQEHLKGLTIQQIIDRDTDGNNILTLLYIRVAQSSQSLGADYPIGYTYFTDEVNATLDTLLYANPQLLEKFKPRYKRGELKAKLRQLANDHKAEQARQANILKAQAEANAERQKAYLGTWGSW